MKFWQNIILADSNKELRDYRLFLGEGKLDIMGWILNFKAFMLIRLGNKIIRQVRREVEDILILLALIQPFRGCI